MMQVFAALLLTVALVNEAGWVQTAHASDDVSRLIQQLHDPDVQHRRGAARELSKITPLPPDGIEAMAGLLGQQSQDVMIERFARTAICNAGASGISLATRFAHGRDMSGEGLEILGCLATKDNNVWPILIEFYKQNPASNAIDELAAEGRSVLPLLFDALKSDDPTMRAGALRTILTMIEGARSWAEYGVRNKPTGVAAEDLTPVKPELAAAIQDGDPKLRSEAAIVLNYADPNDERAIRVLSDLLADKSGPFFGQAIKGLQRSGSYAKVAGPTLERILGADTNVFVRLDAAAALAQIEGPPACAPLERAIAKEDPAWREALIRALLAVNPPCPHIISTVIATFRNERLYDSQAAAALSRMGSSAVLALAAALKSSNLYVRQNSADALAGMKPLPPDAVSALLTALRNKNSDVRGTAIAALRTVGGEAQRAAEAAAKRDEQANAEKPTPDTRLYSRKQIIAPIPADAEYMYPLTLTYIFPITKGAAAEARFFVTVHAGKDRADRLVFWRKVGEDQYQQEKVMYSEEEYLGLGYHFERPFTFTAAYQRTGDNGNSELTGFFVDVPLTGWRTNEDNVFAVENDQVVPVQIDSPYGSPAGGNDFHGGKLAFGENIYNRDDPTCCPTGGSITGNYKIIEDARQSAAVWKIVVATTKRNPPVSH